MRRRIVEALLWLGVVAVFLSVLGKEPETRHTRAALRDLAIDGLYPGMSVSEVQGEALAPDSVYGVGSSNGAFVRFVLGQSLTLDGAPYLVKGDTAERVTRLLGPPDEIVEEVWTYEGYFRLCFRDNLLASVSSDNPYRDPYTDYYFIECDGWSHIPPAYFRASAGSTTSGGATLILSPELRLSSARSFTSSWCGNQVVLDAGTVSVGQSVHFVDELLRGKDSDDHLGERVYLFEDFALKVRHDGYEVVELQVEPRPLNPEPNYEGIQGLIER